MFWDESLWERAGTNDSLQWLSSREVQDVAVVRRVGGGKGPSVSTVTSRNGLTGQLLSCHIDIVTEPCPLRLIINHQLTAMTARALPESCSGSGQLRPKAGSAQGEESVIVCYNIDMFFDT